MKGESGAQSHMLHNDTFPNICDKRNDNDTELIFSNRYKFNINLKIETNIIRIIRLKNTILT